MNDNRYAVDSELVIGLVSPVGVNLDDVQSRLINLFGQFKCDVNYIHLSKVAAEYHDGRCPDDELGRLDYGMDAGCALRGKYSRGDFYALLAIREINSKRSFDGKGAAPLLRHVHVIRSLKHPDEVETLRRVYGDGFFLLGVSASIDSRKYYLKEQKGIAESELGRLISRDDSEQSPFGQKTRDVFQLADAFVATDDSERLSKQLSRVLDLLFSKPVVSPTYDEYAMFMAYAASLRSADLSRQVGAVITNEYHDIIATGANDVPKFGGGLYWPGDEDQRDYIKEYDSNEKEKTEMLEKLMEGLKRQGCFVGVGDADLLSKGRLLLKESGFLGITEYGRPVHAEMEALLSAARNGVSVRGGTLYSTTYPCHNCAKHIIAAGICKVKYIEPYPKSYAEKLHNDAIKSKGSADDGVKKVLFEPFVGIGPRRFFDLFSMGLSSGRPIQRKNDGYLVAWERGTGELRVPMVPLSYLDAEVLMVNNLNDLVEAKKASEVVEASVVGGCMEGECDD